MVGKKYVTKDDLEAFARKLIRRITGATVGLGGGGSAGSGGVSAFLDLDDVPGSYSGESKKIVRVNAGETGLEFFVPAIDDLSDVDTSGKFDGDCLVWDAVGGAWIAAPCGGGSGGGAVAVCSLLDVDCASPYIPEDGDVLAYDDGSGDWRPQGVMELDLPFLFGRRVQGQYYGSYVGAPSLSGGLYGANYLRATPFIVQKRTTFDRLGLGVTSGGGAGRYMRLGIYRNVDTDYLYPGALVLDSGQITVSANAYYEVNISQMMEPGIYYLAFINSYAFTIRIFTAVYGALPLGGMPDGATAPGTHFTVSQEYGALPNPFPGGASISSVANPPAIVLRVA